MTLPSYKIGAYLLRPAVANDNALAALWNDRDPDHAWEGQNPTYWTEQRENAENYVLEDWAGIVFFLKIIRQIKRPECIEVSMQFSPKAHQHFDLRTTRAIGVGFAWLLKALAANGVRDLYFSSRSVPLINFAQVKWGFQKANDDPISAEAGFGRYHRTIEPERTPA